MLTPPNTLFALFIGFLIFHSAQSQGTCKCRLQSTIQGTKTRFQCVVDESCDDDHVCSIKSCRVKTVLTTPLQFSCVPNGSSKCVPPGTKGDPHITGFDGSKFDFHGEDGKNYMIYGHNSEETFVAKVRESSILYKGKKTSYFAEYGLQVVGSSDTVRFYLEKSSSKTWTFRAALNGKVISNKSKLSRSHLSISLKHREAIVATAHAQYTVRAFSLRDKPRRHLDFDIILKEKVIPSDKFIGILGFTLSRKLGSTIHEEVLHPSKRKDLEFTMRKHYQVASLFPKTVS